ncbi:MAG: hypothetical protein ABI137_12715 [Antricoccus sp.]
MAYVVWGSIGALLLWAGWMDRRARQAGHHVREGRDIAAGAKESRTDARVANDLSTMKSGSRLAADNTARQREIRRDGQ